MTEPSSSSRSATGPTLWLWPTRARFGRVVPKSKFYEHANVPNRVREQFVSQVAQVTWAYKLAPATTGLPATDAVPEIEVLEVALKPGIDDVADAVLTTINRAIPAPLLLEVHHPSPEHPASFRAKSRNPEPSTGTWIRLAATPTKDRTAPVLTTDWLTSTAPRAPLPPALDLAALHTALLAPLLPHPARPGESLVQSTERTTAIRRLEREIAALERRVRTEKQFNRRAEVNRVLRARVADLTALTSTPTAEEPPWRS